MVHRQGLTDTRHANEPWARGTQPIHVSGRRQHNSPSLTHVIRLSTITNPDDYVRGDWTPPTRPPFVKILLTAVVPNAITLSLLLVCSHNILFFFYLLYVQLLSALYHIPVNHARTLRYISRIGPPFILLRKTGFAAWPRGLGVRSYVF